MRPHGASAAIAGLIKSSNPAFTPLQIRNALTSTAVDIEKPGLDRDSGAGIILAFESLLSLGVGPQASVDLGTVAATETGADCDMARAIGTFGAEPNGGVVVLR